MHHNASFWRLQTSPSSRNDDLTSERALKSLTTRISLLHAKTCLKWIYLPRVRNYRLTFRLNTLSLSWKIEFDKTGSRFVSPVFASEATSIWNWLLLKRVKVGPLCCLLVKACHWRVSLIIFMIFSLMKLKWASFLLTRDKK